MYTFWSLLFFFFFFFSFFFMSHSIGSIEASTTMRVSTISAAPALLPGPSAPMSSPAPALSPDITPLFPTPGADTFPPSESSLPTIPSSPSPPNPDAIAAPGPYGLAYPPSGFLPALSSSSSSSKPLSLVMGLSLVGMCLLLQLSPM